MLRGVHLGLGLVFLLSALSLTMNLYARGSSSELQGISKAVERLGAKIDQTAVDLAATRDAVVKESEAAASTSARCHTSAAAP